MECLIDALKQSLGKGIHSLKPSEQQMAKTNALRAAIKGKGHPISCELGASARPLHPRPCGFGPRRPGRLGLGGYDLPGIRYWSEPQQKNHFQHESDVLT